MIKASSSDVLLPFGVSIGCAQKYDPSRKAISTIRAATNSFQLLDVVLADSVERVEGDIIAAVVATLTFLFFLLGALESAIEAL